MIDDKQMLDYRIIGSGSSGNAVRIGDMLFDCGVSYKKLEMELYSIRYLLITHTHTDHINMNTFNHIVKKFPRITIIGNWDVARKVKVDEIVGDMTTLKMNDRVIQSFANVHDVPCHGFAISMNGLNIIYATDTNTLENAPKWKYDMLFIESNHDENKIQQIQSNSKKLYGYDAWRGALRHLSTQKSKAFYYMNRRNKDSMWVELHKSKRFY